MDTVQKAGVGRQVKALSADLNSTLGSLVHQHNLAQENLTKSFETTKNGVIEVKVKEIAGILNSDDSELGKAMKQLLLDIKAKGDVTAEEPFSVPGLMELEGAKLIDRYVAPSSLWADVDTYETDPATYVLTPLGRKVVEVLALTPLKRAEIDRGDRGLSGPECI
jgi:hypothetical protein